MPETERLVKVPTTLVGVTFRKNQTGKVSHANKSTTWVKEEEKGVNSGKKGTVLTGSAWGWGQISYVQFRKGHPDVRGYGCPWRNKTRVSAINQGWGRGSLGEGPSREVSRPVENHPTGLKF